MTTIKVRNPHTGEQDFAFEQTSAADVKATVDRVRANQPAWAALGNEGRIAVVDKLVAAMQRDFDAIYNALKDDEGRSAIAQYEAGCIGDEVARLTSDIRQMMTEGEPQASLNPAARASGQWVPYGVVGNISPWNFPLILSLIDTMPALMTGNAVVIKPSEVTPRWTVPFMETVKSVPEIHNVLDVVMGPGETGAELINHVDLIVFTGSVRTGRIVGEAAARNFIPAFLELGGKDPAIVLESANMEVATSGVLRASVSATGQACQSLERVYVAAPIYDEFVEKITEKAKQVTLNTHQLEQGHVGPLIFDKQAAIIKDHIDDAKAKGAKVLNGGKIIHQGGVWVEPTILVDVTHDMKVMTDETFGPVIPIMKFDTVDQAVDLANDTIYGLSGSVFGEANEAIEVAERVNGGAMSINDGSMTAFTHDVENESFGFSGLGGTRFGPHGVLRFVRRKAILNNVVGPLDMNYEVVPL